MDLLEISQAIRNLRLQQNLTVEMLAKKSGFSKGFISQVENFRITPSLKALNAISAALGVPLAAAAYTLLRNELNKETAPQPTE